jgi:hypothetical protein
VCTYTGREGCLGLGKYQLFQKNEGDGNTVLGEMQCGNSHGGEDKWEGRSTNFHEAKLYLIIFIC